MTLKGIVTSMKDGTARVTFNDNDKIVSSLIKIAEHVQELEPGDNVVVTFFSKNMADGVIIAKF
jgi:hypothetical protein